MTLLIASIMSQIKSNKYCENQIKMLICTDCQNEKILEIWQRWINLDNMCLIVITNETIHRTFGESLKKCQSTRNACNYRQMYRYETKVTRR